MCVGRNIVDRVSFFVTEILGVDVASVSCFNDYVSGSLGPHQDIKTSVFFICGLDLVF